MDDTETLSRWRRPWAGDGGTEGPQVHSNDAEDPRAAGVNAAAPVAGSNDVMEIPLLQRQNTQKCATPLQATILIKNAKPFLWDMVTL